MVGLLLGPASDDPAQKNGSGVIDVDLDDAGSQAEYDRMFTDPVTGAPPPLTVAWLSKHGPHNLFKHDHRLDHLKAAFKVGPEGCHGRIPACARAAAQSVCPPSVVDGVERTCCRGVPRENAK